MPRLTEGGSSYKPKRKPRVRTASGLPDKTSAQASARNAVSFAARSNPKRSTRQMAADRFWQDPKVRRKYAGWKSK